VLAAPSEGASPTAHFCLRAAACVDGAFAWNVVVSLAKS